MAFAVDDQITTNDFPKLANQSSLLLCSFRFGSSCFPRTICTSASLFAEPLKKKKRVDPIIEQARQRRKSKRIEREIRRFTRQDRQLKPIAEIEGDRQLARSEEERRRHETVLDDLQVDARRNLLQEWSAYRRQLAHKESNQLIKACNAQQRALSWLLATNIDLYKAAIQPDPDLIELDGDVDDDNDNSVKPEPVYRFNGPYKTPPKAFGQLIESSNAHNPPDGEKFNSTVQFNYDFELDRQHLAEPKKKKPINSVIKAKQAEPVGDVD